jgi:hypothetical protein
VGLFPKDCVEFIFDILGLSQDISELIGHVKIEFSLQIRDIFVERTISRDKWRGRQERQTHDQLFWG